MKELITGRQLSRLLGCTLDTIHRWKENGIIKPIGKLGPCDIYDKTVIEQLKKYIEQHKNDRRYIRIGPIIDVSEWFKKEKKK